MKKPLIFLMTAVLISACDNKDSDSTDSKDSEDKKTEVSLPDCPKSTMEFSYPVTLDTLDSTVMEMHQFDVMGVYSELQYGKLNIMLGNNAYEEGMSMFEFGDNCTELLQINIDDVEERTYDVADLFAPVQPYVNGSSKVFYGTSSAYEGQETTGSVTISHLSDSHVCGEFDITAYHGGIIKGKFSVPIIE